MAEHEGIGAGRSFYETASAEEQASRYSELREALEEIKNDSLVPFSEDWWNDELIWGNPNIIDPTTGEEVGEATKLSKVWQLLNFAAIPITGGIQPGLSVQQVGFDYQPLIIVEDQPTTALALWESNLPVLSNNGAATVPSPQFVGQMAIALNSDPNGVHYPVGVGALPWESFVAYAASTLGKAVDTNETSEDFKERVISDIGNLIPIIYNEEGEVFAPKEVFDLYKSILDSIEIRKIVTGYDYSETFPDSAITITGGISGYVNAYNITYKPRGTNRYTVQGGIDNELLFRFGGYNYYIPYSTSEYMPVRRHSYNTLESALEAIENGLDIDQLPGSEYTHNGKTVYFHSYSTLGSLESGLAPDAYLSDTSFQLWGQLAWMMEYGPFEIPETSKGISIWQGNMVDYTQGGIEIITNPSIDPEPEVQPYYPMHIPDPYTYPGRTVAPEVNPDPHAPSEFPDITPFIQPQVDPEVLPEKEKEKKTTRDLTLPFPTVLPIGDPSSITDPTTDPSQLDWPLPDTPDPPPPPPTPPKPSGITPDIGVPDPALWPTIIPDHSIAGQGAPGLIHVYNPTPQQFVDFGRWLWVTYADATIDKIWNNPFDGVISAHELYYTPTTGAVQNIRSGFLVSTASAAVVPVRYTNINCGTMIIPEYWANYLDYSPYSKAHVYLPFIGIVELDVDDIVGHAVNITYAVDAYNGSCIAQITVAKTNYQNTVYQFSGNCSVEVPLSGGSQAALKSAMLTAGAYGLTSVVAGIMGSVGTAMSGAYGALGSLLNPISQKSSVQHSGSFGASHGAMGIKKPFIIIRRPIQKIVNNYNAEYGFPAHKAVLVGNCTGYLRVREVNVISATATNEEKAKIEELLKEGVYVT